MLELAESERRTHPSYTHMHARILTFCADFAAIFALNPLPCLTQQIGGVTFDLLTWWKLSNTLGIGPKAQGSTQSAECEDWADPKA